MSIQRIDKKHLDDLILSLNNQNLENNNLEIVKSNYSQYGKLKHIINQINNLKKEACDLINEAEEQNELHQIKKKFKLVSGNIYYLYEKETEKYFSLIAPNQWDNKDIYLGAYFYDFDKQFVKQNINMLEY